MHLVRTTIYVTTDAPTAVARTALHRERSAISNLSYGWNLFSITLADKDPTSYNNEHNISLSAGLNLIGISSDNDLSQSNAIFTTPDGNFTTIANAIKNGYLQQQFAYYDPSVNGYRFSPYHDSSLHAEKGYWINAAVPGILTFSNVVNASSSSLNETYAWKDLLFSNGTVTLNITDAFNAGWVGHDGFFNTINSVIWYSDNGISFNKHVSNSFLDSHILVPWRGYAIFTNKNVSLVRQD